MYQDQTTSLKVVVCFTFRININGARVAYTVYQIGDSPGVVCFHW